MKIFICVFVDIYFNPQKIYFFNSLIVGRGKCVL